MESVNSSPQTRDEIYAAQKEASEREDLIMFINACFAATGQTEYYSGRDCGRVSIDFLHNYLLSQLAGHDWNLERCAESLCCRKNELVLRLKNAGFGYLLHQHVLDGALAKER